jgi:hypothetical protein
MMSSGGSRRSTREGPADADLVSVLLCTCAGSTKTSDSSGRAWISRRQTARPKIFSTVPNVFPEELTLKHRLLPCAKIAATAALCLWGAYWHLIAYLGLKRVQYQDFGRFYYAARAWREGLSLYDPTPATWLIFPSGEGVHLWNLNPPHVSLLFLPLTALTVEHAYAVWTFANFFCLAASAQMILNSVGFRLAGSTLALVAAFVFASTPTLSYASTGNLTGPLTLLVTWAWKEWRGGQVKRAGVAIGLATSAKLFFVPLAAYLLLKREPRAFLACGLAACGCFLAGLAVFGVAEHFRWIAVIRDVQWPWLASNSSIVAPLARAAYVLGGEALNAAGVVTAVRIGLGLCALLAALGYGAAWREPDLDRGLLLVILTCLLTFPLAWLYYWWLFAGPLVASLRWRSVRIGFWCSLPGWLIPMHLLWPYGSVAFAVTLGSIYSWSLLVLWSGAVVTSRGLPVSSPPDAR